MNSDEDYNGVYITSPNDLKKERKAQNNVDQTTANVVVEYEAYHFDGPDLLYKEYSLRTVEPGEDSQATNERGSPIPDIPKLRPRKPVVQDIYDEDHYCLARTSGFGPHDNIRIVDPEQTENEDNTSSDKRFTFSCTRCKIIGLVAGVLVLGAIGCLLFFFLPTNACKI